jgi:hypothetical protein
MFEVGKTYLIHAIEDGSEGYSSWEVVSVEIPLIKLRNGFSADRILNTASPMFVRAELSKHQGTKIPVLDINTVPK